MLPTMTKLNNKQGRLSGDDDETIVEGVNNQINMEKRHIRFRGTDSISKTVEDRVESVDLEESTPVLSDEPDTPKKRGKYINNEGRLRGGVVFF